MAAVQATVVREAFEDLTQQLHEAAGDHAEATARLLAVCDAYLDYAARRPQRYRVMFGGVWNGAQAVAEESISAAEVGELGQEALGVFISCLRECVEAGTSTSTEPETDAVALWLGLHGLAQQRTVSPEFPWPRDIQERVISLLAQLVDTSPG